MGDDVQARAFQFTSPLLRRGPWVCDARGAWVAHHSLPLFGRIHGHLPRDGWWRLDANGPVPTFGAEPDLAAWMADLSTNLTPAVLDPSDTSWSLTMDEAMQAAAGGHEVLPVLSHDGRIVYFDAQVVYAAKVGDLVTSWHLAATTNDEALVGCDRKNRPRFALAELTLTTEEA